MTTQFWFTSSNHRPNPTKASKILATYIAWAIYYRQDFFLGVFKSQRKHLRDEGLFDAKAYVSEFLADSKRLKS